MVKADIDGYCDVSHTGPLIDSMFPVHHSDINDVYDGKLVRDRVYDEINERWSWLPTDEKAEAKYYTPFVRVAEAIRKAYPSTNVAPKSMDKSASLVRPDILNILGMDGDAVEWDSRMNGLNGESHYKP
ncbi:hypothetical protein D9615_008981 [Tricholomella constricta]|uniref:Uncharacterized protein n=1 Tax=Tricholomella constricta TaxID=117010 RepID=A0A8H5H0D0_9AGAR|nr:hypothetical protein D9615_008981 [Tricholomella constricta]